jgi:hypothetical protein
VLDLSEEYVDISLRGPEPLQADQLSVAASCRHQGFVGTSFGDCAILKHVDMISILYGAQSMGYGDGGAPLGRLIQGSLYNLLRLRVES